MSQAPTLPAFSAPPRPPVSIRELSARGHRGLLRADLVLGAAPGPAGLDAGSGLWQLCLRSESGCLPARNLAPRARCSHHGGALAAAPPVAAARAGVWSGAVALGLAAGHDSGACPGAARRCGPPEPAGAGSAVHPV